MATDYSIHGRYTEDMLKGTLYAYRCPGQALLLSATTGNCPTLWNPAGSGKVFIPVALVAGFLSGTTTIGSVLIAETLNAGANISATAPIVTFTDVAGVLARRSGTGTAGSSAMRWAPTTCTFVAAPTVHSATSLNFGAVSPTNDGGTKVHYFDGMMGFDPGSAMSIVYSVTTSTALFHVTLYGLELPMPIL